MLYQPNYCCHCGEKVERISWKLWTSRRFCENCESAFRKEEWLPKIGSGLAVLIGLFGFGSYLKTPEKPLNVSTTQLVVSSSNKTQNVKHEQVAVNTNQSNSLKNQSIVNNVVQANNQNPLLIERKKEKPTLLENQQNVADEPVYFCGAQTKKGTPCTRKVKGGGRCWQHLGQPAILEKEKLRVKP